MSRAITRKRVQVHFQCVCGLNVVDQTVMQIRYKDFKNFGIVRKKDKRTGSPFLLQRINADTCHCNEEY